MIRNRFLWHEVVTTDPEGAKTFYGTVVGWGTAPFGDGPYTLFTMNEAAMAGLMPMPPELRSRDTPPHWLSYVGVRDCDAVAADVARLGGTVLQAPWDIPVVGRVAVVADPQGAVFCLWTPTTEPGPMPDPIPVGDFCWHELSTTDPAGALRFYGALFGWTQMGEMDMGEMGKYQFFGADGKQLGGIYPKPDQVPVSNWLPYAMVASADAAADAVLTAGGTILQPPTDVPGGRITMLMDPQGAVFAVHSVGGRGR